MKSRNFSKRWLKNRERTNYQASLEELFIAKCWRKMSILETWCVVCIQTHKHSHFTAFARVAPVNILTFTWWSPVKVVTVILFPALCSGLFWFLLAAVVSVKILADQLGIFPTSNTVEWICHYERIAGLILIQISYLFTLSSASESDHLLRGGVQEGFSEITKFGCLHAHSPSPQGKFLCLCKASTAVFCQRNLCWCWASREQGLGHVVKLKAAQNYPRCSQVS